MRILGQGHKGIVLAAGKGAVKKFYLSGKECEREKASLKFLSEIRKQGFDIGCMIPKIIGPTVHGQWKINNKTYIACNQMEFVPGMQANANPDTANLDILGHNLATVLFAMHTGSKRYVPRWTDESRKQDKLLTHILKDKAARVIKQETDSDIRHRVQEAAQYLEDRKDFLISRRSLSHSDLNLTNILVNSEGRVEGLVDWGGFGLINPTLSLYQLATNPDLWPHIKKRYEKLGGVIMDDILYAASTIHLAWAPLIFRELDLELDEDETRKIFEEMYACFTSCRASAGAG